MLHAMLLHDLDTFIHCIPSYDYLLSLSLLFSPYLPLLLLPLANLSPCS